jgi:superfamily II DNA or RNA helicase/HKD family nuclease/SOS-response transcriptional repressor LexA
MPIDTITYYDTHAEAFFSDTQGVDMAPLHRRFLAQLPNGAHILDAGCGSGRDSKAFLQQGYRVTAFDASAKLVELAQAYTGLPIARRSFGDVDEVATYDGIWACASLLHLPESQLSETLQRLWQALKPGGLLYLSFKYGKGERNRNGRHFTDATESRLADWLACLPGIASTDVWITHDQRPGRDEQWLNALIHRTVAATDAPKLIIGGRDHPFLPQLSHAIAHADEIDMTVAFIKTSGLRLLMPDLQEAMNRATPDNPVRLRILTSDYLDVTDPEALRLLILLQSQGAQIKVFESNDQGFHMKAYLFAHFRDGQLHGTAFIGSSNISRQALTDGLEWNYRIDYPGDEGFLEARKQFEILFGNPRCVELSDEWINTYESRRKPMPLPISLSSKDDDPPPEPTEIQRDALAALGETRFQGFQRGLVVLATGLGKTWLAAFDTRQAQATRILFVAHREEILTQAATTFLRIRPQARIGFYTGRQRDSQVDILCASIQTLGRVQHLQQFVAAHFDYIVVDEFHHAAAPMYRRLLQHFTPRFLLGLTATPDRSDQSDILALCDDNLVFERNLFAGINGGFLAPFHYFGILDESVDYREIPWRNGQFDPETLSNKLATLARAKHALREWQSKAQTRTLAFCVSRRHADFMAEHFRAAGITADAVYSGSNLSRGEALQKLADGQLQVIFSVDLFNEGVDLPAIDTVMMLRPTESKILFLQQLGRGLRHAEGKSRLVVLDFIANHKSFLHKPQALAGLSGQLRELGDFARKLEKSIWPLPEGCFINYDLRFVDFLKSLDGNGLAEDYATLRELLGRRPTLTEFYRAGSAPSRIRQQYGSWFGMLEAIDDLDDAEKTLVERYRDFFIELETTAMTRSFKMVLLESFQNLQGWSGAVTLSALAQASRALMQRRPPLLADLPEDIRQLSGESVEWQRYWHKNPVNAWTGESSQKEKSRYFIVERDSFKTTLAISGDKIEKFADLVQELIDFRFATYDARKSSSGETAQILAFPAPKDRPRLELPYFEDLRIACGHFRTSTAEVLEHRSLPISYGQLDPARHFIARAVGNSMNGGKHPIHDGDFLLLELLSANNAGSISGHIVAIERQDDYGDSQYLLRVVAKKGPGRYILKANNPDYEDLPADDTMRTLARLKQVIDPLDLAIGQLFMREEIPTLFGEDFNPGSWNSGHVVLNQQNAHVLLVTLNKQGKTEDHRYTDYWIDENTFHWQSQNATTPLSKRGREIIEHKKNGRTIHLFVRENKLAAGKAAPFLYYGPIDYVSHQGSEPMSVTFTLENKI